MQTELDQERASHQSSLAMVERNARKAYSAENKGLRRQNRQMKRLLLDTRRSATEQTRKATDKVAEAKRAAKAVLLQKHEKEHEIKLLLARISQLEGEV